MVTSNNPSGGTSSFSGKISRRNGGSGTISRTNGGSGTMAVIFQSAQISGLGNLHFSDLVSDLSTLFEFSLIF